jgi:chromosome partitioning protein
MLGLQLLSELVAGLPEVNPKPQMRILMNGIPRRDYDRRVEDEIRGHPVFGPMVLSARLYQSKLLHAVDRTGFAIDRRVAWGATLRSEVYQVADELHPWLGVS